MKWLGLMLLAAGIALGALWPWAQLNLFGRELARLEFGKPRFNTVSSQALELSDKDNLVRIRFQAAYSVGGKRPPVKVPFKVTVTDTDGLFLTGGISFPTRGNETGPEQEKVRASTPLQFNVLNNGLHRISISLAPNPNDGGISNPDIAGVSAVVVANAAEINDDYKALAAVLALAGIYILLRSRRHNPNATNIKPPDKWGRG
ncbi:MAG: hypothetical protein AAGA53_02845 [Pseudomonadota bacterium]